MMLTDGQIIGTYKDRLLGARESAIAWGKESRRGLRCGILGCSVLGGDLHHRCPICLNYYCDEHVGMHFHLNSRRNRVLRVLHKLRLRR